MEITELKNRAAAAEGWYLFAGEEAYLKRYWTEQFRRAVIEDDAAAVFNEAVFDGPEIDVEALAEAVRVPPVMSDKKFVVWKYPDFLHMKEHDVKVLDDLLAEKSEYLYTVLIFLTAEDGFDAGTPKKPSKAFLKYQKTLDIVLFHRSTDVQLLSWLKKHFEANGIRVSADALNALIFRAGHAMDDLAHETEKLSWYLLQNGRDELTRADVEAVAGATAECDAFALSNALLSGDRAQAFAAIAALKKERTEPSVTVGMIARTVSEWLSVSLLLEEGKDARAI